MNLVSVMRNLLAPGPRGRLYAALLLLVISIGAALQVPYLVVDRSDDRLISPTAPGWADFQQMQEDFGAEQTLIIYLRAADLWTEQRLKQLQQLTFDLEDLPEITAVSSLLSATNIRDKGEYVDAGPLATIVPDSPLTQDGDLFLTYRNFGDVNLWGADLAFDYLFTDQWSLGGTWSWVSDDFFSAARSRLLNSWA